MVEIILLGGFGRMGRAIQEVLLSEDCGAKLVAIISEPLLTEAKPLQAEVPIYYTVEEAIKKHPDSVVIDFTTPEATTKNAKILAEAGIPLVIGTTGFTDEEKLLLEEYATLCPILLSSNMSKGINTLVKLLPYFVASLGDEYDIEIVETHHNKKKDAPSGTALTLAKVLADAKEWELSQTACCCREGIIGERPKKEIGMQTVRGGGVAGIHTVSFLAEEERIEITHHAHSRKTFARGAIYASVWLHKQTPKGIYTMQDTI